MLLRDAIGGVLRGAREAQGKTLHDVAGPGRLSVPYLSEIERGRKEASSEVIAAVCAALGIDQSELLRDAARLLAPVRPVVDLTRRAAARDLLTQTSVGGADATEAVGEPAAVGVTSTSAPLVLAA